MTTENEQGLIEQLRGAMKSRALVYAAMFEEIAAEFGADKAREICKRAIYKRGEAIAGVFAPFAPADLAGLTHAFLNYIPHADQLFAPEVLQSGPDELEIQFHRCPLKEAWLEAGYDGAALENLCDIGGVVDYGTFEKAGFRIRSDTWRSGRDGCCRLHITPGPAA
jgi:hypothetical protein